VMHPPSTPHDVSSVGAPTTVAEMTGKGFMSFARRHRGVLTVKPVSGVVLDHGLAGVLIELVPRAQACEQHVKFKQSEQQPARRARLKRGLHL
jgi:hypothetical protein